MISDILDETKRHKNFYRDNFRRVTYALSVCMVLILILSIAIIYRFFTWPDEIYLATSSRGQLTQLLVVTQGTGISIPTNA